MNILCVAGKSGQSRILSSVGRWRALTRLLTLLVLSLVFWPVSAQATFVPAELSITLVDGDGDLVSDARWRVVGESTWRDSGATASELKPGPTNVEFEADLPYAAPAELYVVLPGGALTQQTVAVSPILQYAVGLVPPLEVRLGDTVEFLVIAPDSLPGASINASFDGGISGISWDPTTQIFRYTAEAAQRERFEVNFSAQLGATTLGQPVPVQPIADAVFEQNVFPAESATPRPSTSDPDYLIESVQRNPAQVTWNWRELYRTDEAGNVETDASGNPKVLGTAIVTVSGMEVHIGQTSTNKLYQKYHETADVEEFIIYADTVRISDFFHLPQTKVVINARALVFEDREGRTPAAIVTTPLAPPLRAENVGEQGDAGLTGGAIELNVDELAINPPDPVGVKNTNARFVTRGGAGQQAGPGQVGVQGTSVPEIGRPNPPVGPVDPDSWQSGCTYAWQCCSPSWDTGNPTRPTNGTDATAPGLPGTGGIGGDIVSTIDVASFSDVNGGAPGEPGWNESGPDRNVWPGGPAGTPTSWVHLQANQGIPGVSWPRSWLPSESGQTRNGQSAPVRFGSDGKAGTVNTRTAVGEWFHPSIMRSVLLYARDLYLFGFVRETQEHLRAYQVYLEGYLPFASEDEVDQLEQMQLEMESLLFRIGNNLDFFGNPAGYAPMLSLASSLQLYQDEVNSAIEILHLTYWLLNIASETEDQIAAITAARENLKGDVEATADSFSDAANSISNLDSQVTAVTNRMMTLTETLELLEQQTERDAQNLAEAERNRKVPFWKKALGTLGAVLKVAPIPGAQPLLAGIGTGLDLVTEFDTKDPVGSVKRGVDMFNKYKQADFVTPATEFRDILEGSLPDEEDLNDVQAYIDTTKPKLKQIEERLSPVRDAFKGTEVTREDVGRILDRIRATDSRFADYADSLEDLNRDKERVANRLSETINEAAEAASSVMQGLRGINAINENLRSVYDGYDLETVEYIRALEQRARERLLYYQYLVDKSFEYAFCRESRVDYALTDTLDEIRQFAETSDTYSIRDSDRDIIAGIFSDEIRNLVQQIVTEYETGDSQRELTRAVFLNNDELQTLNETGEVVINMVEKFSFPEDHENIRLVDVTTRVYSTINDPQATERDVRRYSLNVRYQHSGISRVQYDGAIYQFDHRKEETNDKIFWESSIRFDASDLEEEATPDFATEASYTAESRSILAQILGLTPSEAQQAVFFARPSAWADVVIKKIPFGPSASGDSVQLPGSSDRILIDDLEIQVSYSYKLAPAGVVPLIARVSDNLMPEIRFSVPDANGRSDGFGTVRRLYPDSAQVSLTAEPVYGEYTFDFWADAAGDPLAKSGQNVINVRTGDVKDITATYKREVTTHPSDSDGDSVVSDVEVSTFIDGFLRGTDPEATDVEVSLIVDIFKRGGCYAPSGSSFESVTCP